MALNPNRTEAPDPISIDDRLLALMQEQGMHPGMAKLPGAPMIVANPLYPDAAPPQQTGGQQASAPTPPARPKGVGSVDGGSAIPATRGAKPTAAPSNFTQTDRQYVDANGGMDGAGKGAGKPSSQIIAANIPPPRPTDDSVPQAPTQDPSGNTTAIASAAVAAGGGLGLWKLIQSVYGGKAPPASGEAPYVDPMGNTNGAVVEDGAGPPEARRPGDVPNPPPEARRVDRSQVPETRPGQPTWDVEQKADDLIARSDEAPVQEKSTRPTRQPKGTGEPSLAQAQRELAAAGDNPVLKQALNDLVQRLMQQGAGGVGGAAGRGGSKPRAPKATIK